MADTREPRTPLSPLMEAALRGVPDKTDTPKKSTPGVSLLYCALAVPLTLYVAWTIAFTCSRIWAWHAVPAGLPDAPAGVWVALTLVVGLFRRQTHYEGQETSWQSVWAVLLGPWGSLLVAWVLR